MSDRCPLGYLFYITEDHEDGTKKTARCKYGAKCFFVSAESKRLKAYHLKCCDLAAIQPCFAYKLVFLTKYVF